MQKVKFLLANTADPYYNKKSFQKMFDSFRKPAGRGKH